MSWGATAAITAIVSTVASAAVAIIGNENAKDAADDAAVANKQRADAEARNREMEAAEAIKRQRARDRRDKAALRARLAQSGTLTTTGTPLALIGDMAANQELRIQDSVRAANAQATAYREEGKMGVWEAKSTGAALTNDSIGSGIGAVGSAVGLYTRTKKTT